MIVHISKVSHFEFRTIRREWVEWKREEYGGLGEGIDRQWAAEWRGMLKGFETLLTFFGYKNGPSVITMGPLKLVRHNFSAIVMYSSAFIIYYCCYSSCQTMLCVRVLLLEWPCNGSPFQLTGNLWRNEKNFNIERLLGFNCRSLIQFSIQKVIVFG